MKIAKCFVKAFVKLVYVAAAAISFLLLCINLYSLVNWLWDRKPTLPNVACFIVLLCLFALFMVVLVSTRFVMLIKNRTLFIVALILLSFATKALFVIGIDTTQYSDFALLLDTTYEIAEGSRSYLQLPYYQTWPYQTGFPAVMSIFSKLFGGNITVLLLINCMFAAGTNVLVYCIARQKTDEKAARVAAIIYLIFPYVLGLSSVYTNQHLATFLFYVGVYVLFRYSKSRFIAPLTAGLLLALGNSIRPEGVLFIASIVGYAIFNILGSNADKFEIGRESKKQCQIKSSDNTELDIKVSSAVNGGNGNDIENITDDKVVKEYKHSTAKTGKLPRWISVVVSYFLFFNIVSQIFIVTGLNPDGLTNDFPLYKFAVGLNHSTNGSYSDEDVSILFGEAQRSSRDEEALRMIRERLSVPLFSIIRLFKNKASIMWVARWRYPAFFDIPNEAIFKLRSLEVSVGRLNTMFTFVDYLIYLIFYLIIFLSSLLTVAGKKKPAAPYFAILIAATFVVFLIIEVQYRYAYIAMPAIFIWSAEGAELLYSERLLNIKMRRIKADGNLSPNTDL